MMLSVDEYQFKTRPYAHQVEYLRQAVGRQSFACFADLGVGKSKMLIDEMAMLWESGLVNFVLVTTRKGNYRTWEEQLSQHMPDRIPLVQMTWTHRTKSTVGGRMEQREFLEAEGLRVLLVNIEALTVSSPVEQFALRCLGTSRRRMVVVDESTLIKNEDALRTKKMVKLAAVAEYRRIATGNPAPNGSLDLWGQFKFLGAGNCQDLLGFRSFYAYRARYCVLETQFVGAGRTVQVPVAYQNTGELRQRVRRHSFRVRKEDCLDLPPKVYQRVDVELTPEQRTAYEDMRRRSVTILEEGRTVSAALVLSQMSKLQQIVSGVVMDDQGTWQQLPSNRLRELRHVIEESGRQTIVWCAFRANIAAVVAELRSSYGPASTVEYHGGVSTDDRQRAIELFQRGDSHFFVGTPHTGGMGITLTAAKNVVYYSNSWDLELRVQSEDRAHRIGQDMSVTYVDLISPGTLDERIVGALRKKIDIATEIMGDRWREWLV